MDLKKRKRHPSGNLRHTSSIPKEPEGKYKKERKKEKQNPQVLIYTLTKTRNPIK